MFASVWDWQGAPDAADLCCVVYPLGLAALVVVLFALVVARLTRPRRRRRGR